MKNPSKRKPAGSVLPIDDLVDNSYMVTPDPDPVVQKMTACIICSSETQTGSPENMCWVCRRLKISAWRDVEQQIPAQE